MNIIVYVAIALLVLVLIVAFTTGGFQKFLRGITTTAPGELETLKNKCTTSCDNAMSQATLVGTSAWGSSTYCTERYGYDADRDGNIASDEFFNCWSPPLGISCSVAVDTATGVETWDETSCETGFAATEETQEESPAEAQAGEEEEEEATGAEITCEKLSLVYKLL